MLPPIDTLYFLPVPGKLYEIGDDNEVFLASKMFNYHYMKEDNPDDYRIDIK
jgi:hypothetical protein